MKITTRFLVFLCALLLVAACSRKKSTFMTRNFHAVNTEYNALYNGNMALDQGKRVLAQNYTDDYWEILPVERVKLLEHTALMGETDQGDFLRAEEKAVIAVQKHAIELDGKEHNPKIDEAYMLLGKARYYDSRFIPAMEAFNFVLNKFPTSNSVNEANIWRAKTNIRLQNEEMAIKSLKDLMARGQMSREEYAGASAMLGQAYINMEDLETAVIHIDSAAVNTKDKEERGRLLFIKGQLYNRLGQKDSANKAFDDVIALKRNTFRVYMINAEMEKVNNFDYEQGDQAALVQHLTKLWEDRENRPFLDLIFHHTGNFYNNQDSIGTAIAFYNKSIQQRSSNKKLQGYNYMTLGKIYFDKAEYRTAGAYYDSTLNNFEQNTMSYRRIKKKRENLEDVINFENIAQVNDSILRFVAMSEEDRRSYFTVYTDELKEKAIADSIAKAKEERKFRDNEFFKADDPNEGGRSGGTFYFYNPTNIAQGKQQFERRWGRRPLEDNWRRSDKSATSQDIADAATTTEEVEEGGSILDDPKFDPETYLTAIPSDPAVIDSITKDRNLAYYQLGIIYQEKFKEYQLAVDRLETLLTYGPEERLVVPTKYYLYKLYGILEDPAGEQRYKNDILTNHPDTRYAGIILNPDTAVAADESSPEFHYKQLYRQFEAGNYTYVVQEADEYINQFVGDDLIPKFELLKATALGRVQGFDAYKNAMNHVALSYPNSEEGKQAQDIYDTTIPKLEKFDFDKNDQSDSWKLIYTFPAGSGMEAAEIQSEIELAFAEKDYTFLRTTLDFYTPETTFLVVHGFSSKEGARGLAQLLLEDKEHPIDRAYYPISSPNYTVVQMHKNLEAYHQKDFPKAPQPEEEAEGAEAEGSKDDEE